jgi:hypothetical protein
MYVDNLSFKQNNREEEEEFVDFYNLRDVYIRYDSFTFNIFIEELFLDLSYSIESEKYVSKSRFQNLLPEVNSFISDKIYNSLCKSKKEDSMKMEEFRLFFYTMRYGNFDDVNSLFFNLFDFDKDGKMTTNDLQLLMSYLPLNLENKKSLTYKYQMQSLSEITQKIKDTFGQAKELTLEEYKLKSDKNPDIFILIFSYLYLSISIFKEDLKIYSRKSSKNSRNSTSKDESDEMNNSNSYASPDGSKILKITPSCFSPITNLKKKLDQYGRNNYDRSRGSRKSSDFSVITSSNQDIFYENKEMSNKIF